METPTLTKQIRHGVPVLLDADGRVVEFWIRLKNWCRCSGKFRVPGYQSMLLVPDGYPTSGTMCCVGHYSLAIGYSPDDIKGICYFSDRFKGNTEAYRQGQWLTKTAFGYLTQNGRILAGINDDETSTDKEKRHKIAEHFAKQGITAHFSNGIPPEFQEAGNG